MHKTYKISISGLVQGVGFRPYVYLLAESFSLNGTVSNNELGVVIYVSGIETKIQSFFKKIIQSPPPVSNIQNYAIEEVEFQKFEQFSIVSSKKEGQINLPLTPDFAICKDCKNDITNNANKRLSYAFTTCVNCGPRYSITRKFPFEREHTSIDDFPMCDACKTEYTNPTDRRFHSQTNTCNSCGIKLFLKNSYGEIVTVLKNNLFKETANLLSKGKIIAIKNTSGYLLCCNAENKAAIKKLRSKKNRPNKPFAVLFPSLKKLQAEVNLNQKQINSLTSTERPINIIPLKNYNGNLALNEIAPELNQLGVMLPYTGILQLLANQLKFPIIATSGNLHGSPIISNSEDAFNTLKNVADYFLDHNLKIEQPQDDSVVKYSFKYQQEILFRRSRGFAPNLFNAAASSNEKIMAMGAHLKSSIAFYPNDFLYISQYLGNLDNFDVYNRFVETTKSYINIFEEQPEVVLIDKHPSYQSAQYGKQLANETTAKLVEIQHHKAHFSAVLGEHNLFDKKVLGVVFDGTGFGDDGNIWGGEFFNYETNTIERISQIENYNWLLGDKMSKEPRVSLLSLASESMIDILKEKFTSNELKSYQYLKQQNKLKTSSVGRLFDAVASLLNITDFNFYEGEAAILLENSILNYNIATCKNYISSVKKGISAVEIIQSIYEDIQNGVSKEICIVNFLFTLADSIIKIAELNNYQHIACSGGVFQNSTLIDLLIELVPKEIKLYFHKDLSPNDENISFGQQMYYLHINN